MDRRIRMQAWIVSAVTACLVASTANAQPPRQQAQQMGRARQACEAAAAQNGYRVLRRDQENVNGGSYQLPMHVSHGSTEADVTCSYDAQRGYATVPTWDDRTGRVRDADRDRSYGNRDRRYSDRDRGYSNRDRGYNSGAQIQQAQSLCQNYVGTNRRFQVVQVGTAVRQGQNLYDVPVTVRRNNGREATITCRYNAASNKLSMR